MAFDPNNVSQVWLLKDEEYYPFELIEKDYLGHDIESVKRDKHNNKSRKKAFHELSLQSQLDLLANIDTNIYKDKPINPSIKGVRENRKNATVFGCERNSSNEFESIH